MRKELLRFLLVGFTTVAIDFASYRLLATAGLDTALAKGIGFIAGTVFAYLANRLWTFGASGSHPAPGSIWRFALLYATTLVLNVGVNAVLLHAVGRLPYGLQAAFVVATGMSAAANFVGMKYFVFVRRAHTLQQP